jgi:hypothetical protein
VPCYCLDTVRTAAKNDQIEYRGRKAQRDITNLGYEHKDVLACLISLTESDFYKTYQRNDSDDINDAYRIDYPNPSSKNGGLDSLYIKFCLINNHLMIDLASFHLNG